MHVLSYPFIYTHICKKFNFQIEKNHLEPVILEQIQFIFILQIHQIRPRDVFSLDICPFLINKKSVERNKYRSTSISLDLLLKMYKFL